MSDISPVHIIIRLVRDRPSNFIQVLLGDEPNADCACGGTLSEALRELADRLDFTARRRLDAELRRVLFPGVDQP